MSEKGVFLYIVATPIGNLGDISKRAIEIITASHNIICENPKHSLKLLNNLGLKKKLISIHDYNEKKVVEKIELDLKNKGGVLISDSGSPLISDPGFKLVQFCIENNIKITSIPGPSAIIPALQLSGLPINEFSFFGFLPKSENKIADLLSEVSKVNQTIVFFVSKHRIIMTLKLMEQKFKNRKISVSKELTKINEKVFRGKVSDVKKEILQNDQNLKGEFVVVIGEQVLENTSDNELEKYTDEIKRLLSKFSLTDVVQIVHKLSGINKNKVYKWILNIKD
tara:strand:- start:231 stop:1073 length:843 start_codon:yes stop_codon:yes gene_type:complete